LVAVVDTVVLTALVTSAGKRLAYWAAPVGFTTVDKMDFRCIPDICDCEVAAAVEDGPIVLLLLVEVEVAFSGVATVAAVSA
jgi:hypothetical protein